MTFFVERHNGECWTCLLTAEHYVNPSSIGGPPEQHDNGAGLFPPARTPGNKTAFAGLPGWQARVRFDDQVMEIYDWEKVLENPADPESARLWGWCLRNRYKVMVPPDRVALGELSVM